jgi:hypothetical protein
MKKEKNRKCEKCESISEIEKRKKNKFLYDKYRRRNSLYFAFLFLLTLVDVRRKMKGKENRRICSRRVRHRDGREEKKEIENSPSSFFSLRRPTPDRSH